jgi:hypothetical protein
MMPYWIASTLAPTPALLWMFFGLGLPWALVVLPRRDWHERAIVACLTLAFGPAILTAWMFVLGSLPGVPLLRVEWVLLGTATIATLGWFLVWQKKDKPFTPAAADRSPLRFERLLIALIALAVVIRWLGVAYWPSTAYDALWVYAYQGKLYTLLGHIPPSIDYYPQFLQLQHTYLQLAVGGIDDHAARAVLPWLHVGSILAAYTLGKLLIDRRVGLVTAAIWALYPHLGEWSRYGDLEVPMAFLFTTAATFFLKAWIIPGDSAAAPRRSYAIIAGLLLGIGMWTKPTMGGFIWGVALLAAIEIGCQFWKTARQDGIAARLRASLIRSRPRLEVVALTALLCVPLGAVWYLRNAALGHEMITFPDPIWTTRAARSGVEFGWPLLALIVLTVRLWSRHRERPLMLRFAVGAALILLGLLPTLLGYWLSVFRPVGAAEGEISLAAAVWRLITGAGLIGGSDNRIGAGEWLAMAAGLAVLIWALRRLDLRWPESKMLGWALLLALPYFVTWFLSYSYHYRLSFAIAPLMILPTAALLVAFPAAQPDEQPLRRRGWLPVGIALAAIPGLIAPLYDGNAGWDWLWTNTLPDDHARYASGNRALMTVVDGLQLYLDQQADPLRVIAPGMRRLPFFFPLEDIQIDHLPTSLDELADATYFIYSKPETGGALNTYPPGENAVIAALALATENESDVQEGRAFIRRAWGDDDGIFQYTVYELHLENRFKAPFVNAPTGHDVVFDDALRLLGHDIGGLDLWPGRRLILHLYWEVLEQPSVDYTIYVHLRDPAGNVIQTWDSPVTRAADGSYYSSLVWEPGEFITDPRIIRFDAVNAPLGTGYSIVIGLYDRLADRRAAVTINGQPAGDGYLLNDRITIVPPPAS